MSDSMYDIDDADVETVWSTWYPEHKHPRGYVDISTTYLKRCSDGAVYATIITIYEYDGGVAESTWWRGKHDADNRGYGPMSTVVNTFTSEDGAWKQHERMVLHANMVTRRS